MSVPEWLEVLTKAPTAVRDTSPLPSRVQGLTKRLEVRPSFGGNDGRYTGGTFGRDAQSVSFAGAQLGGCYARQDLPSWR